LGYKKEKEKPTCRQTRHGAQETEDDFSIAQKLPANLMRVELDEQRYVAELDGEAGSLHRMMLVTTKTDNKPAWNRSSANTISSASPLLVR
jgi:hypothetical protein